jgi:hypothetical protein
MSKYDSLWNWIKENGIDSFNAIILCNVQDLHVMITYDKSVIKRMEGRKAEYPKYQESIDVINELKK